MSITSLTSERGSFHLLPNYGTILPSTGATFCHCRAQNDASGEKFRDVYLRHSKYAFRLLEAWFCSWKTLLSILPFTLHLFAGNPDKHWGHERWRVFLNVAFYPPPPEFSIQSSQLWVLENFYVSQYGVSRRLTLSCYETEKRVCHKFMTHSLLVGILLEYYWKRQYKFLR